MTRMRRYTEKSSLLPARHVEGGIVIPLQTIFACLSLSGLCVLSFFIVYGLVTLLGGSGTPAYVYRVGIIGSGPAGASAAYNVHKFARSARIPVEITVFDREGFVGGRSTHKVKLYGDESSTQLVEASADGFSTSSKNLVSVVGELRLGVVMVDEAANAVTGGEDRSLGVFDGNKFVYIEPHPHNFFAGFWNTIKMFFWYGYSPKRTVSVIRSTVSKIQRVYSPSFFPFASFSDVLESLNLGVEVSTPASKFFGDRKIGGAFQKDLIACWTRSQYGQNLGSVSALAAISVADLKGGSAVMTVPGGHSRLFESMVDDSKADLKLNTTVFGIRKSEWGWVVGSRSNTTDTDGENQVPGEPWDSFSAFDSLVLAAPFQYSNLEVRGPDLEYTPSESTPYSAVYVTLFTSKKKLSRGYFHHNRDVPKIVLTTLTPGEGHLSFDPGPASVGKVGMWSIVMLQRIEQLINDEVTVEWLYKITSPTKIPDSKIHNLVGSHAENDDGVVTWIYRHSWPTAFPQQTPRPSTEIDPLKLDERMWYTGGVERVLSSMEMAAFTGASVARLMVNGWISEGKRGGRPDDWWAGQVQGFEIDNSLGRGEKGGENEVKAKVEEVEAEEAVPVIVEEIEKMEEVEVGKE